MCTKEKKDRESMRKRDRARAYMRACVCVFVCVRLCVRVSESKIAFHFVALLNREGSMCVCEREKEHVRV